MVFRKRDVRVPPIMPSKRADPWLFNALPARLQNGAADRLPARANATIRSPERRRFGDLAIRHRYGDLRAPRPWWSGVVKGWSCETASLRKAGV